MRCQVHAVNKGKQAKAWSLVKGEDICSLRDARANLWWFPLDILGKLQTAKVGAAGHAVVESKANGYL